MKGSLSLCPLFREDLVAAFGRLKEKGVIEESPPKPESYHGF